MSRITDILLRVRDSLADHDKQRWSDERLLRLLDEGQRDLAIHSRLLKGHTELSLNIGVHTYDLPDDLWLITRAAFDGTPIELWSHDRMDEQGAKDTISHTNHERSRGSTDIDSLTRWELDSASYIDRLIFDNRNMQQIRVYPIPNEGIADYDYTFHNAGYLDPTIYAANSPYGVLTGMDSPDTLLDELGVTTDAESVVYLITDENSCNGVTAIVDVGIDSPFGVVGEIEDLISTVAFHGDGVMGVAVGIDEYTTDSIFGCITDVYDPAIQAEHFKEDIFGVVTGLSESVQIVDIWYVRTSKAITLVSDELELPSMFDKALKQYVIGNAFLDDNDAANRQKGQDALALYDRELGVALETNSLDAVSNPTARTTSYRGAFQ